MNKVIGQVWEWCNITEEVKKIYLLTDVNDDYVKGLLLYCAFDFSEEFVGKEFCFVLEERHLLWTQII